MVESSLIHINSLIEKGTSDVPIIKVLSKQNSVTQASLSV